MPFFGKTAEVTDSTTPRRASVLGTLFNPRIGDSIRPLAETTSIFVQLIAMVFAMNGLFPKDHPALQGVGGARLTLAEIFSTAWNGLSFTKQGIPKVILFFAVTGTMIFAILSVITALMAGMMGHAHAATSSSGFFSPVGSDDLAQNWLDYIFKGQPLSDYYAQDGKPIAQSNGIQCSMITALGFYSEAMLIFAAIILFYHLVSMVVNTAHEGVAMGKRANQVWAPIRLVVAVGLLVPMGSGGTSCTYGANTSSAGLNAGQYIVIKMASWGSGLASQTWKVFIDSLQDRGGDYIQPSVPEVSGLVKDVAMMEACRWLWNYRVCTADVASSGGDASTLCADPNAYAASHVSTDPAATGFGNEYIVVKEDVTNPAKKIIHYSPASMMEFPDVCGTITFPQEYAATATASPFVDSMMAKANAPAQIGKKLSDAHKQTFTSIYPQIQQLGAEAKNMVPGLNQGPMPSNSDYITLANTYLSTLKTNLDSVISGAASLSAKDGDADKIAAFGWAGAGAWLNTIARDQGAIIDAYENGLPKASQPDFSKMDGPWENAAGASVKSQLDHFGKWMDYLPAGASNTILCNAQMVAAKGGGDASGTQGGPQGSTIDPSKELKDTQNSSSLKSLDIDIVKAEMNNLIKDLSGAARAVNADGSKEPIVHAIFRVIDAQAKRSGVWDYTTADGCKADTSHFKLGAQLVTSNPLQEFSFWGHANLRTSFGLWEDILDLSMASQLHQITKEYVEFTNGQEGTNRASIVREGLQSSYDSFVAGIFSLFATIFMSTGFTVAFVAPLLPFFRFFFNVLTWIVSVLEAIVAIPLVALAHLNPEGEGLPGQSAKAGYFMIFNIFVRPVLTVFGLIAGLLIFYVAVMLLNMTFAIAVEGTNADSHAGYTTLVRIAFTVTYAATVYTCANNAFKTIGFFPEHALRWIGQQAWHERMGDGGRAVQGVMGQVQGTLGDKALGVIRLKS